jgi:predicted MFS family arabinose efflux permease
VLFLVGWMVTPLQAMLQTIVQASAGDAARGRVVSLLQASLSTASVTSMAVGGILAEIVGVRAVYLGAAVIVVGASVVAFLLFRGVPSSAVGAATPEAV